MKNNHIESENGREVRFMFNKIKKYIPIALPYLIFALAVIAGTVAPAKAADDALVSVTKELLKYIGRIFKAVGVFICAYSVGQLILAMKNEDADSKSRAATQLAVGAALFIVPTLINNLNLTQYITGTD